MKVISPNDFFYFFVEKTFSFIPFSLPYNIWFNFNWTNCRNFFFFITFWLIFFHLRCENIWEDCWEFFLFLLDFKFMEMNFIFFFNKTAKKHYLKPKLWAGEFAKSAKISKAEKKAFSTLLDLQLEWKEKTTLHNCRKVVVKQLKAVQIDFFFSTEICTKWTKITVMRTILRFFFYISIAFSKFLECLKYQCSVFMWLQFMKLLSTIIIQHWEPIHCSIRFDA